MPFVHKEQIAIVLRFRVNRLIDHSHDIAVCTNGSC